MKSWFLCFFLMKRSQFSFVFFTGVNLWEGLRWGLICILLCESKREFCNVTTTLRNCFRKRLLATSTVEYGDEVNDSVSFDEFNLDERLLKVTDSFDLWLETLQIFKSLYYFYQNCLVIQLFWSLNFLFFWFQAIGEIGWERPTQIQRNLIPLILENKNVTARGRTGSGKTGAFMLPIIQKVVQLTSVGFFFRFFKLEIAVFI